MEKTFWTAVQERRSYYSISKAASGTDERIQQVIQEAVKHSPSPFNSQSSRVVVLFGSQHDKLWDIVKTELMKIVPAEQFGPTAEKIQGFANGYGSVLFFEDMTVVENLQNQFPTYRDNFPIWSNHASGMLQYVTWTALETEGLGASLQHYNPLIDERVKQQWQLPASWKLIAQMPFGKPEALPGEKEFQPLDERIKIFK